MLLDRGGRSLYPISWSVPDSPSPLFRLPAIAYLTSDQRLPGQIPQEPGAIAVAALAMAARSALPPEIPDELSGLLLNHFKPCLQAGLLSGAGRITEVTPVLQWSDAQEVSLAWVQQAVRALLATLHPDSVLTEDAADSPRTIHAPGLDGMTLKTAMGSLEGVVLGYPTHWSDTYAFNLREAVLDVGLVRQPEQIVLVEESIAALLTELAPISGGVTRLPLELRQPQTIYGSSSMGGDAPWIGGTLVLDAGAAKTDLLLVNLPGPGQPPSYEDFCLQSLAYGGDALDQDIVCQLLYPQLEAEGNDRPHQTPAFLFHPALTLPLPADPDPRARHRLHQRLTAFPLGRNLLETARHLKQLLQHQGQVSFDLEGQSYTVSQRDLEVKVLLPLIQRLNRELNHALSKLGLSAEAVHQVICTGGTASLPAIAQWLRQKLPNAILFQDLVEEAGATPDRVACGLALVPLYPQVLDSARQQYSDYFLLLEMLRILPNQPLPLGRILQLLEHQGINTRACQFRLLALLEGQLPQGLVPSQNEAALLTNASRQTAIYRMLTTTPLFMKQGRQTYQPNREQSNRLRRYLSQLMVGAHQSLEEPLPLVLELPVWSG